MIVTIIQGHPDPGEDRFCHALADAYASGADVGGHTVNRVDLGRLEFPVLRDSEDWQQGIEKIPGVLKDAYRHCADADHLVFVYPLWMGTMPALLKAFIEQIFRPGFALAYEGDLPKPLLKGVSARIIVTMGMPSPVYRWFYGAHSLKSLERNILKLSGIRPVSESLFGAVEAASTQKRQQWLRKTYDLGRRCI